MHPLYAVIAAGLGSMLADVFAGYAAYAPATLVIKAGVALIAALVYCRFARKHSLRAALPVMIGLCPSACVMLTGSGKPPASLTRLIRISSLWRKGVRCLKKAILQRLVCGLMTCG
jgi:uncharacterized membrane protein